jgi:hypothetical protein
LCIIFAWAVASRPGVEEGGCGVDVDILEALSCGLIGICIRGD